MLNEGIFHEAQSGIPNWGRADAMDTKLSEIDRRTVDLLLSGDGSDKDAGLSSAVLERVNAVRRVLGMLSAIPVEEPPTGLIEATLRKAGEFETGTPDSTQQAGI